MGVAKTIVSILDVLAALGVIASVLLQSGKSAGLSGSIAGGAETIFGKKKGMDELFEKLTTIFAISFMVLTLVLALLNK
ncbi:MAG: preprotein translocase subunit SecG [Solirubrobacterales bacterium]